MKLRSIKIVSVLIVFAFFLSMGGVAMAFAPPPIEPPPPGGGEYRVYGYVKDAVSSARISGALVKVYANGVTYVGSTTTSSTGYFNFYYTTSSTISKFKVIVSKSGYLTASKTRTVLEWRCYMGTIYLTSVTPKPAAPTIENVYDSVTIGNLENSAYVSWSVGIDSAATTSYVEFHWYDGVSWIKKNTWTGISDGQFFGYTVSNLNAGEYQYKIIAYSTNAGGTSSSTYGPIVINVGLLPTEPAIIGESIDLDGMDGTLSFDVNWGSWTDGYLVRCYWAPTPYFSDDCVVYSNTQGLTSYSIPIENLHYGLYTYKIEAIASNEFGSSSFQVGPSEVCVKAFPTDDTFTSSMSPTKIMDDDYPLLIMVDNTADYEHVGWFRFTIDNPNLVRKATLKAYAFWIYSGGHGTIHAYAQCAGWEEEWLTWDTQMLFQSSLLDTDSTGVEGEWDEWDVTARAAYQSTFSVALVCDESERGVGYYSREYSDISMRPYLEIEYFGQEELVIKTFRDDHFGPSYLSSDWEVSYPAGGPLDGGYEFVSESSASGEGTLLQFPDQYRAAHSSVKGYYFDQTDLEIRDGFLFELKWGYYIAYQTIPHLKLGIQLLGSYGSVIAEIYVEYAGSWSGQDAIIKGFTGETFGSYSQWYDPGGSTMPHDVLFRIYRDPYLNEVQIDYFSSYYGGFTGDQHHIVSDISHQTVETVRLFIESDCNGASFNSYNMQAWFDFVKYSKVLDLGRVDSGVAPFSNPIYESSFEESSLTYWTSDDGSPAVGNPSDYSLEGYGCWEAWTTESSWSLRQDIDTSNPAFDLDSVRSRRVSFSYHARYMYAPGHDVRMRAVIYCWRSVSPEPLAIVSDWFTIVCPDPTEEEWNDVCIRSMHPLPYDVEGITVAMYGESIDSSQVFGAYIDSAKFTIIEDEEYTGDQNYSRMGIGFAPGISIISTVVSYCAVEGSEYVFRLAPLILAYAEDNCEIWRFEFDFELLPVILGSTGSISLMENGIVELNDQGLYGPEATEEQMAARIESGKWALKAMTGIACLTFGITFPLSTVAGFIVGEVIGPVVLPFMTSDSRVFIDTESTGQSGNIMLDYRYMGVTVAFAGVVMEWRCPLDSFVGIPSLRFDYTVGWSTFWDTRYSMIVAFNPF